MAIRYLPVVGRPTGAPTRLRLTRAYGNAAILFGPPGESGL
jgi:hypothetical protein